MSSLYGGRHCPEDYRDIDDQSSRLHDWRLHTRGPVMDWPDASPDTPIDDLIKHSVLIGYAEFWYCTRCRQTDERMVPAEPDL